MKIVSVINYKGGVGKTTVTANLGAELARRGQRVLLIDLDPQASLTFSFIRSEDWERHLSHHGTIKTWFDSFDDMRASAKTPAQAATVADQAAFLDVGARLPFVVVTELEVLA